MITKIERIIKDKLNNGNKIIWFLIRVSHIRRLYYRNRSISLFVINKKGNSQYCYRCWNCANGVETGKVLGLKYTLPKCRCCPEKFELIN